MRWAKKSSAVPIVPAAARGIGSEPCLAASRGSPSRRCRRAVGTSAFDRSLADFVSNIPKTTRVSLPSHKRTS